MTLARVVMNFHISPSPRWIAWVKHTRIYERVWNWSFDSLIRERAERERNENERGT